MAVAIDEKPANWTPISNSVTPVPPWIAIGAYWVQPAEKAPTNGLRSIIAPARDQHPERQRVQARERHVLRPDHDREDVVRQAGEGRDDEQEDHQHRVDAEEAVVLLAVDELRARLGELGADRLRLQPAHQEEEEGQDDVLDADHLVIGVDPEVRLPAGVAVQRVVVVVDLAAEGVLRPEVEAADAGEEAEARRREPGDVVRLVVPQGVQVEDRAEEPDQEDADAEGDRRHPGDAQPPARERHGLAVVMAVSAGGHGGRRVRGHRLIPPVSPPPRRGHPGPPPAPAPVPDRPGPSRSRPSAMRRTGSAASR